MMAQRRTANGRCVLVVEDESLIAFMIEDSLCAIDARIVGPAAHLHVALELASGAEIDAALLDVNIRGGTTYAVADLLADRGIPFAFCSGYADWTMEERHRARPRLNKPFSAEELEDMVLTLLTLPATTP